MAGQTANNIIIDAFMLIGEYSPDETPSGSDISQGLSALTDLLSYFAEIGKYIPYTNDILFNTVPTQAKYVFSRKDGADVDSNKIIEVMDAYIDYNGINIPLTEITHDQAYQIVRFPNATTRPSQFFRQNTNDSTEITLFYTPDQVYKIILRAKVALDLLALQSQITTLPQSYIRYFKLRLAKELLKYYESNSWNEQKEQDLKEMENDLFAEFDTDWSLNVSGVMRNRHRISTKAAIIVG